MRRVRSVAVHDAIAMIHRSDKDLLAALLALTATAAIRTIRAVRSIGSIMDGRVCTTVATAAVSSGEAALSGRLGLGGLFRLLV